MKMLHMVTFLLLVVGGLNWLLQGIFGWEIGYVLPGGMVGIVARVVYILVGVSAVIELATHKTYCKHCAGPAALQA